MLKIYAYYIPSLHYSFLNQIVLLISNGELLGGNIYILKLRFRAGLMFHLCNPIGLENGEPPLPNLQRG